MEEFLITFEQLRMRCGIEEDEEQLIGHFLGALRSDIADVVMLQQYWSFSDVCRLAQRAEKILAAKPKPTPRFSSYRAPAAASSQSRVDTLKAEPPTPPVIPSGSGSSALRCFKCQGVRHLKRDCPNKQVVALVDDVVPTYDTEAEDDKDAPSEIMYPDRGEATWLQKFDEL